MTETIYSLRDVGRETTGPCAEMRRNSNVAHFRWKTATRRLIAVFAAIGVVLPLSLVTGSAAAATIAKPYDFNGDGYAELAIGAPGMRIGSVRRAGGVVVLPGTAGGLSLREKIISQSSKGVPGTSEREDRFGTAVTSADFDRDGYADLVVGQPGEDSDAGRVTVVYGSRTGLNTARSATFTQGSAAEGRDEWGSALAAADFNLDSYPDLAVGAPGLYGYDTGAVGILPGGRGGLTSRGRLDLHAPESDRYNFGIDLATGDLDEDGDTDLVVLSAGINILDGGGGGVDYCTAGPGGPSGCTPLLPDHEVGGLSSVAVGNAMGDARPEIVVGAPGYDEDDPGSGAVWILQLAAGLDPAMIQATWLTKSTPGIPGSEHDADYFGDQVALSDIDRDGYSDLVVGAPGDDRGAGRVTVIYGARSGWRTTGNFSYSQNTAGIPGKSEREDSFGASIALLDHNRDGRLDLSVGAPGENGRGAVTTLRGSGAGFTTSRARTFTLATLDYRYPTAANFGARIGR